ncbi:MAG: sigma-54-dependent transcriptional regulator [Calditrichia bacterium]
MNNQGTIVYIDDDPFYEKFYRKGLQNDFVLHHAMDLPTGLELIRQTQPGLLLLDISLKPDISEDTSGIDAISRIRYEFPHLSIIMVTGHDKHTFSSKAIDLGAKEYFIKKTQTVDELLQLIKIHYAKKQLIRLKAGDPIAVSEKMQKVLIDARKFARSKEDILITGEAGTGKEEVADFIFKHSGLEDKPFIKVNIASLSSELMMSELVGHKKGAFTGANSDRIGRFEEAGAGFILLDEIGDMRTKDQVNLLRILEERSFQRIGSNKSISLDARVISATNADMNKQISKGSFREDLYSRLNICKLDIPPLREREADIIPLAQLFIAKAAQKNELRVKTLSKNAKRFIRNCPWPSNARELRNAMTRALITSKGPQIRPSDIKTRVPELKVIQDFKSSKKEFERQFFKDMLAYCKGNISKMEEIIGITRQSIHKKINEYGLNEPDDDTTND